MIFISLILKGMGKLMLERINYLNDKKIISILNDNHVVQHRTKQEIKNLIDLYKKSNKNEDLNI